MDGEINREPDVSPFEDSDFEWDYAAYRARKERQERQQEADRWYQDWLRRQEWNDG